MSVQDFGSLRKSAQFDQIFVAGTQPDLYDSRKATGRVPRQDLIAAVRAVILVTFLGGALWLILFRMAIGIWNR